MLAFSGRIRDRSGLRVSPAVENTLSDGVEDAWTHRYFSAKADSIGNVSLFIHHQSGTVFGWNGRKASI